MALEPQYTLSSEKVMHAMQRLVRRIRVDAELDQVPGKRLGGALCCLTIARRINVAPLIVGGAANEEGVADNVKIDLILF